MSINVFQLPIASEEGAFLATLWYAPLSRGSQPPFAFFGFVRGTETRRTARQSDALLGPRQEAELLVTRCIMNAMVNEKVVRRIVFDCLSSTPEEGVAIVTDKAQRPLADQIHRYTVGLGYKAELLEIVQTGGHGREPTEDLTRQCEGCAALLLLTTYSLTHTQAVKRLVNAGKRVISMPLATEEVLNRCIDIDYQELAATNLRIRELIEADSRVHVCDSNGNELRSTLRNTLDDNGDFSRPGALGNLPCGEVHSGVTEMATNGVITISHSPLGTITKPLTFTIENGKMIDVTGEQGVLLVDFLEEFAPGSYLVAEFGIGTNPRAVVSDNLAEIEKVRGTVHIALGNDTTYGGSNSIPLHLDFVASDIDLTIGTTPVFRHGQLVI